MGSLFSWILVLSAIYMPLSMPIAVADWNLIHSWGMENGQTPNVAGNGQNCHAEMAPVTSPVSSGSYALEMRTWGGCGGNGPRAQLSMEDGKIPVNDDTRERRYTFDVYMPQSVFNNLSGAACNMMTQWYGWNGHDMDWQIGRPPTVKFWQRNQDGNTYAFSHRQLGTPDDDYISPLRTDAWEHWDIRVRWSNGADGYMEGWKNGKRVFRKDGPTFYDPSVPESFIPRWDIGVYNCDWEGRLDDPSKGWTNYFDNIKIYIGTGTTTPLTLAPPENLLIVKAHHMAWTKRKKITIDADLVPSDQANIPIPVVLDDTDIAAAAQADGDDIAFFASDGTTPLPYARVSYDDGKLVARVRLGTILGASDTDFYVYYGDVGASDQQDRANTFSNGYVAYWPMDEDPSGSAPQMVDYTGNGHNGTSVGSMTNTDEIVGQVGNGYAFDGTNDYVSVGTMGTLGSLMDTTQVTMSLWVRTIDEDELVLVGGGKSFPNSFLELKLNRIVSGGIRLYARAEGSTTELDARTAAGTSVNDGDWHKIDVVVNKATNTVTFYLDGSVQTTTYDKQESVGTSANFTEFALGAGLNGDSTPYGWAGPFDLDEVSLALAGRSADWIETMFNAEFNGAFLTLGAEEDLEASIIPVAQHNYRGRRVA